MSVEILSSYAELAQLVESGAVRAMRCGMPTQLPAWMALAVRHFHTAERLWIVVVRQGDYVTGMAPFNARYEPMADFQLAGAALYEPGDLIWQTPEALEELVAAVAESERALTLARVPAGSPTVQALQALSGRGRTVLVRSAAPSPVIPLNGSATDTVRGLNARRRQDLRRARRRAEDLGGFSADFVRPSAQDVDGLMDAALEIEAASWKGREGSALKHDPARGSFYRDLARTAAATGRLLVGFGHVGGRPAAMQIALESGNAVWLLKIGYDPTYARCSPGQLLMEEAVRHAASGGAIALEFLGTQEPWTRMWTDDVREYVSVYLFPWNWRGFLSLARKTGVVAARRVRSSRTPMSS